MNSSTFKSEIDHPLKGRLRNYAQMKTISFSRICLRDECCPFFSATLMKSAKEFCEGIIKSVWEELTPVVGGDPRYFREDIAANILFKYAYRADGKIGFVLIQYTDTKGQVITTYSYPNKAFQPVM